MPKPSVTTNETLEDFAESAYLYATDHKRDEALAASNDPTSTFVTQEYYVFAIAKNWTLLANSYLRGDVGTDISNYTDTNGVKVHQNVANPRGSGRRVCSVSPAGSGA